MRLLIVFFITTLICLIMTSHNNNAEALLSEQSNKPLFSFGILADVQYCDCDPMGTRFYRSSPAKLREAMSAMKKDSVEFIINLGDLIDRDFTSFKTVMDIIDSSGVKIYHTAGNHDYSVDARLKKKIPVIHSSIDSYYSFTNKNFRFIVLNGNEVSTYISSNKSITRKAEDYIAQMKASGEVNAVDWNGGLGTSQIGWLKEQLDESVQNDEKVFICCHFPVVPETIYNLLDYKDVLRVLENYHNIVAWFNAHNHEGNYGNINLTHFVTFKGMVETQDKNSFASVEVYTNKIWIRGSGREKNQILAY